MADRKLSKRLHLTVTWQDREGTRPTPAYDGGSPIYSEYLHFKLRRMHLRGSNRPRGYYHDAYYHNAVNIRWLWTEDHGYFAPEITFNPSPRSLKIAKMIIKALEKIERAKPEELCEALGAMIVERVENEPGMYEDYRPVRLVGEPAMATIARAAL